MNSNFHPITEPKLTNAVLGIEYHFPAFFSPFIAVSSTATWSTFSTTTLYQPPYQVQSSEWATFFSFVYVRACMLFVSLCIDITMSIGYMKNAIRYHQFYNIPLLSLHQHIIRSISPFLLSPCTYFIHGSKMFCCWISHLKYNLFM